MSQNQSDLQCEGKSASDQRPGTWMMTYSGKRFYPLDPRPEDFCIKDIAHALARICRFGGHTRVHYSVAQHSYMVARLLEQQGHSELIQLSGLLHDAVEAYVGDMIRPMKEILAAFLAVEEVVSTVIYQKFKVPQPDPDDRQEPVWMADDILLVTEKRDLLPKAGKWPIEKVCLPLKQRILPVSPDCAERMFLERYWMLAKKQQSYLLRTRPQGEHQSEFNIRNVQA